MGHEGPFHNQINRSLSKSHRWIIQLGNVYIDGLTQDSVW